MFSTNRFLLCLLTSLCLWGCAPAPQSQLDTYLSRLENLTQNEAVATPLPLHPLPRSSELLRPVPELDISILELGELNRCGLSTLIGERNSALGRQQVPVTRLIYRIELLRRIPTCVQDPEIPQKLKQKLQRFATLSQSSMKALFWNYLVSTPAIRQQFQPRKHWPHADASLSEATLALTFMLKIKQHMLAGALPTEKDLQTLLQHQAILETTRPFSDLLFAQRAYLPELASANTLLRQAPEALQCAGKMNPQANYLLNVFNKYYSGQIQPYLVVLNHWHQALVPHLESLLLDEYSDWWPQNPLPWYDIRVHTKQHARAWQDLFKSCKLSPF